MMNNQVIIVSAGGTGGHIIPAVTIAKGLESKGYRIVYIGNKGGMEEKICHNHQIDFIGIQVQKLYRKLTLAHLVFPVKLIKSIVDCIGIFKKYQPVAFIGTGGFVCGPAGLAAYFLKIPMYIHEQNQFPGITTRFLGSRSVRVFTPAEGLESFFPKDKIMITGNPIFTEKLQSQQTADLLSLGLDKEKSTLLILGGSQGSLFINQLVLEHLDEILGSGFQILWQTGVAHLTGIQRSIGHRKGVYCFDFTNEMHCFYNSADISICRAGALTLAELEEKKIPSIMIPLPTAAGNHQYYNALGFEKKGYGYVLEQTNRADFMNIFKQMSNQYRQLKSNFKTSLHSTAKDKIVDTIEKDLKRR